LMSVQTASGSGISSVVLTSSPSILVDMTWPSVVGVVERHRSVRVDVQ
jgi:hypothetical protein